MARLESFASITLALGILLTSACTAPAPSTPAGKPPAAETAVKTPAPANTPVAPASIQSEAFAGKFSGVLPCASCPGIDTALVLRGDGSFHLSEIYQDEPGGGPFVSEGHWREEQDSKRLRLSPIGKADPERLYEIVSRNEIRMLDLEGKPIVSGLDYSLRRDSAGNP